MAALDSPAETRSDKPAPADFSRTSVRPPGQNASANASASGVNVTCREAAAWSADVDDQGIERRPPLGLENARDGARRGGIGAEAVYGFRWERDQTAAAQAVCGFANGRFICAANGHACILTSAIVSNCKALTERLLPAVHNRIV